MFSTSGVWREWFHAGCFSPNPLRLRNGIRIGVLAALTIWIFSSLLDFTTMDPNIHAVDRYRFDRVWAQNDPVSPPVAVALSGGGYRAAVMHAGVLFALEQLGIRIMGVSAVSGGAIIASYYVNGGDPEHFLEIVQQNRRRLTREVTRFPTLLHLLSPLRIPGTSLQLLSGPGFTRSDVEADLLDRLYLHGVTLRELADDRRPLLMLCATDLNADQQCHLGGAIGHAHGHNPGNDCLLQ